MDKQKENFERLVRSHKDTIYTVCYMFSKDEDEVAELFLSLIHISEPTRLQLIADAVVCL